MAAPGSGANFVRTYAAISFDKAASDTAADFVREKIRQTVRNRQVAEKLLAFDHATAHAGNA